ncbi:TPA: hypothetical protein QCU10_001464 [Bacillus anthracis]|nr:hypothetical protein [Bacillus cereus biovar anthracis]HDR6248861.1 hypothetical protein [Bacillus cereus biovar anthracis]
MKSYYCCPKCGTYSGGCFEVKEKRQMSKFSTLPNETLECVKCGWKGSWGTAKQIKHND